MRLAICPDGIDNCSCCTTAYLKAGRWMAAQMEAAGRGRSEIVEAVASMQVDESLWQEDGDSLVLKLPDGTVFVVADVTECDDTERWDWWIRRDEDRGEVCDRRHEALHRGQRNAAAYVLGGGRIPRTP